MPPRIPDDYLTAQQTATLLAVHPHTITTWAKKGLLPHTRTLGGHRRYPRTEIQRLARTLTQAPTNG